MSRRLRSPAGEDSASDLKRHDRSEDGDTLIEVLLAIVVLGLASVAILIAFATGISGSAEHRNLATMDTVLRSAAEQAISQIGQQTNTQFEQCPVPDSVTFSPPSGYRVNFPATGYQTEYWNSATSSFSPTCPSALSVITNPPVLNAPQLVAITITNTQTNVTSAPLSFVVDDTASRPLPVAGSPTHLVFLTSPGNSVAGTNFSSQPVVAVEDASGNIVDYSADLGQTPPPGAHYVPSPMPFFMRLTDEGVGMHAGFLPGYPASHGCIRLPAPVAENIFHQVSIGTQVDVVQ